MVRKTIKEVQFQTRYSAAIIAIYCEGKHVHDHLGKIKLQAGNVLLLEAGLTFIKSNVDNDKLFMLLAEVKKNTHTHTQIHTQEREIQEIVLEINQKRERKNN